MTQTQSDRLKDVQRQYAEMEHNTATLQNAQQRGEGGVGGEKQLPVADRQVPGRISRAAAGPRGVEVRAAHAAEHGSDRGAFGALAAGLTTQAARWLWDTFLAVLSSGWATLAAWWNS